MKNLNNKSKREIKRLSKMVDAIEALDEKMQALSDDELRAKTQEFKDRLTAGETLDDLLVEAFAVVREAADRVLHMKPYRVQLMGGIVLHQGRIAEMKTGEGKTLVSTLPAYLNALEGKGVHIVTVNDYLAERDANWMGQVHRFLGLSVGVILNEYNNADRKAAYDCDITYITNNELGFDYLRDNMVMYKKDLVQRDLHYAIVDEVDSVLIDEARTPLIISGQGTKSTDLYKACDALAKDMERGTSDGELSKIDAIMGIDIEEDGDFLVNVIQNQRDFYNYEVSYAIDCAVENLMKQDGFEFHYSFSSVRDYKDYRKRYLEEYDLMRKELFTGGYKIKTTIDHNAQEKLQKAVDSNLAQFTKKQKDGEFLVQGAATIVDNTTGKVIAIVGGRSQESEEGNGRTLNRAFQSYNQPGSTIKPLVVYTPAFEKGYSTDTIVNDQKFEGGPSNSDGLYKGLIKVSQAVIESRNTVAWQILDDIGPKAGLKYVQNMDFSHIVPSDYYDAAALGGLTYGVNTVEMASGYATIKNGGIYRKASCIDSIEDSDGNEVKTGEVPSRVYKQYATKEITEIMQDVIKKGTGRGLSLERGMPSAGKTGTTNNQRSGWFCGFSPYYSIAVWVGTDNNDEVKDLWGGTYPGSIWKDSMNALCSGKPVVSFDTTLTKTDLLEKSGKTSSNGSTATTTEKKVATTATTESEGDEEDEDDVVSRLNDLIYDYEELEIQSDSDLAQVTSIEGEIEDLLAKLKTKDNQKFYRKVYEQAKGEVQTKINQYKSSLGNSSTQMPTDQTTSNTTTESTESDSSAGSGTDNSTDGSDGNGEFGWQN